MSASRRLFLILHGKAAQREDVRGAIETVRERGNEVQVRVTYEDGDSERYAKEAVRLAQEGLVDVVVAGGGDGTLNQVVNASLTEDNNPRCSFGLLPLGTANDFARGAGLPVADLSAALSLCAESDAIPIDLGEKEDRVFVNLLTGGTGTRITVETDPGMKGDTAQGGSKPATLSTGAVVNVPLFITIGEVLKVDTRSGEYVNRVKSS